MQASIVLQKTISPILNLLETVFGIQEEPVETVSPDIREGNLELHQQDQQPLDFEGYDDNYRSYAYHGYQSWRWQIYHPYLGAGWASDFYEDEW